MTTWMQRIGRLAAIALASLGFAAQAGEITAYTSLEEDDVKVYLDAFAKAKPGIKVNVLRLSTGDLAARMLAEKSNPRHDVIWGWAVTQMVDPRFLEMAEPYKPAGIEKVNAQFKDPDGRWFAFQSARSVDPNMFARPFRSWIAAMESSVGWSGRRPAASMAVVSMKPA